MFNRLICLGNLFIDNICDTPVDWEVSLHGHIDGFYFAVRGKDFVDVLLCDILSEFFNDDFGG